MKTTVNFYNAKEILSISEIEIVMSEKTLQEAEMLPGQESFLGLVNAINAASDWVNYSDDWLMRFACNQTMATVRFHSGFAEIIRLLRWNGNEKSVNIVSANGKLLPGSFLPRKWVEREETGLNLFIACRTDRRHKKYRYFSTSHPEGFWWDRETNPISVSV